MDPYDPDKLTAEYRQSMRRLEDRIEQVERRPLGPATRRRLTRLRQLRYELLVNIRQMRDGEGIGDGQTAESEA